MVGVLLRSADAALEPRQAGYSAEGLGAQRVLACFMALVMKEERGSGS